LERNLKDFEKELKFLQAETTNKKIIEIDILEGNKCIEDEKLRYKDEKGKLTSMKQQELDNVTRKFEAKICELTEYFKTIEQRLKEDHTRILKSHIEIFKNSLEAKPPKPSKAILDLMKVKKSK
jgi:hypothetical protein